MNLSSMKTLLLGTLALVAYTAFAANPSPAVISAVLINDDAPYKECHASTIVQTAQGGLVAAWFGGTKERNPDVGIWVARHEAGQWLPAVEVANGVQEDGSPRQPTWNPVLFQAPDGPLVLFYKVGPSPSKWWGMVMESRDGGRTWGAPRRLPATSWPADAGAGCTTYKDM